jgi:protein phosphatase
MIGSSNSGKTTFAQSHFKANEVLSSDFFRSLVGESEEDQSATRSAFAALRHVADLRLKGGRLAVVDATSLRRKDRFELVKLAKINRLPAVALVLNPGLSACQARSRSRADRAEIPEGVLLRHDDLLLKSLPGLPQEGFEKVFVLSGPELLEPVEIVRVPWPERRQAKMAAGPKDDRPG